MVRGGVNWTHPGPGSGVGRGMGPESGLPGVTPTVFPPQAKEREATRTKRETPSVGGWNRILMPAPRARPGPRLIRLFRRRWRGYDTTWHTWHAVGVMVPPISTSPSLFLRSTCSRREWDPYMNNVWVWSAMQRKPGFSRSGTKDAPSVRGGTAVGRDDGIHARTVVPTPRRHTLSASTVRRPPS